MEQIWFKRVNNNIVTCVTQNTGEGVFTKDIVLRELTLGNTTKEKFSSGELLWRIQTIIEELSPEVREVILARLNTQKQFIDRTLNEFTV